MKPKFLINEVNKNLTKLDETLKKVNSCLNINIYYYLETSGGQSSKPYLNFVPLTPELIRNLWQLKTAFFLHWCLICAVPLLWISKQLYDTTRD